MAVPSLDQPSLDHPRSRAALRTLRLLVGCYLGVSALTVVAIVLLRHHSTLVTPAAWVRAIIVLGTASLMMLFTAGTARGSSRSYLRLRLASGLMLVAIAVIIAIPGDFPLWLKVEQGACGLLLLGVAFVANGRHLRSLFAK